MTDQPQTQAEYLREIKAMSHDELVQALTMRDMVLAEILTMLANESSGLAALPKTEDPAEQAYRSGMVSVFNKLSEPLKKLH